jgi:hypothetical protein
VFKNIGHFFNENRSKLTKKVTAKLSPRLKWAEIEAVQCSPEYLPWQQIQTISCPLLTRPGSADKHPSPEKIENLVLTDNSPIF